MSKPSRTAPQTPAVAAAAAIGAVLLGLFVFRPGRTSTEVREWTPRDHDQPAGAQPAPNRPKGTAPKSQDGNLVEMAWARSCASCHGAQGRGDGPQGPMLKAPDLTRAAWQEKVTDEEIAQTIRKGRNAMPAFELPPNVVQGLVQRIRANRAQR